MDEKTLALHKLVPQTIHAWLASEKILDWTEKATEEYGFGGELQGILPRIILRVEVKVLAIKDIAEYISGTAKLEPEKAAVLTHNLVENVFRPIENELRAYGIDLPKKEQPTPSRVGPVTPPIQPNSATSTAPAPRIIKIKTDFGPIKAPPHPFLSQAPKPSGIQVPQPLAAPTAKIQLGTMLPAKPQDHLKPMGAEPARVIHYGSLKTMLSAGTTDSVKTTTPTSKAPVSLASLAQTAPKPSTPSTPPRSPLAAPSPLPGVRGVPPPPPHQ